MVESLSPAVTIDQQATGRNPFSTVGTITGVHDHLRLLHARIGRPHPGAGPVARDRKG